MLIIEPSAGGRKILRHSRDDGISVSASISLTAAGGFFIFFLPLSRWMVRKGRRKAVVEATREFMSYFCRF